MTLDLPTKSGWCADIKVKGGGKIFEILPEERYKTKDDVEKYINSKYGIGKEECTSWSICECSY